MRRMLAVEVKRPGEPSGRAAAASNAVERPRLGASGSSSDAAAEPAALGVSVIEGVQRKWLAQEIDGD